ncbi:MAG TPA: CHAT domain-containing protein [Candidatus Sulfotelmatobacter sp.]|nr:CHAT domain-containing protein [Candidatus Sulfotelmatobacter sp.]
MGLVQSDSNDWSIRRRVATRGSSSTADTDPTDFPPEFLTEESAVVEQFVSEPKAARRGQSAAPDVLDVSYDLAGGEAAILSIRHPSGALTFHAPIQYAGRGRGRGQANKARFVVTVRSTDVDTGKRGIGSKVFKLVLIKVAKVVADKAVSFALPKLVTAFERNSWNKRLLKEGWLKVTKETLAGAALVPGKPTSPERSLLFIHGTFSNAASAYGALARSNFFNRVKDLYGDRMFAFDHFSLSRTPHENARMLLESLPEQTTTFDVITHSRGGLVLRNLVERSGAFGPIAQRFKLGRAVLVASPNEGTPLATPQRWGDTVGWIANLLELFPENPFTTGAEFVANGLVWLARHASGDIPGLHSMDSNGEMIVDLQTPPGPPMNAYSALVSNYNPTGAVLRRMLDTGIDQFFGSANDLVVPTQGGWRIPLPGTGFVPPERIGCYGAGGNLSADSVTHVSFFSQPETVDFLARALLGEQQLLKRIDPVATLPDHHFLREGASAVASSETALPQPPASRVEGREKAIFPSALLPTTSDFPPILHISVVNGDLTFEAQPLMIGHYRASRLTGTEGVANDLIGNAMKRSLDLGLYPLAPGSHQVFVNSRIDPSSLMPRPPVVIVVGLGEEGKLRAADLVHSVRQAVIAWAQPIIESETKSDIQSDNGASRSFDISATLLGSGGSGITPGQAAKLIAEGVYAASVTLTGADKSQETLASAENTPDDERSGKSRAYVRHLRIVERYLDRATEAWRALIALEAADRRRFKILERIETGTHPLTRPAESGYRGADYDFVSAQLVRGDRGETSIQYTLDTKRARSEVRAQKTQVQLVRHLVTTASTDPNSDKQIGRTLFKLLVPVELDSFFASTGEMQLELEPETAGIPWELIDTDDNGDFNRNPWAIRAKLIRKLRIRDFREQVTDTDAESHILVIGEPECPADYARLPGAWNEAIAVGQCLTEALQGDGTKQVQSLVREKHGVKGPDARKVMNALHERDWRIVHVAGHGELKQQDGSPGGVVLSNGTFFGAREIATMRAVPELVFVNCCHLAARDAEQLLGGDKPQLQDRVNFASGMAEELIKIGVKCVIAAGWAVDDTAASKFATEFYDSLVRRKSRFLDAVAEAREAAYRINREDKTWAAYQCYGDPDWVFDRKGLPTPSPQSADGLAGIASARALELVLETIRVELRMSTKWDVELHQLGKIRDLENRFASKWGDIGSVAEYFGKAYAGARELESAIRWYQRAVAASDGTASMRAAEQLANVRARLAWETVTKAQKHRDDMAAALKAASTGSSAADRKARAAAKRSLATAQAALQASMTSARQSVKDALTLLDKLVAIQSTIVRESIYGAACKRLALIEAVASRPTEEREAIEAMKFHYQRAALIAHDSQAADLFYPALNYFAADIVLNAGRPGWKGLDASIVEATHASLEAENFADPNFWSVVGKVELQLYRALAGCKLANESESIERDYQDLYRRVSAPWMWSSVYDTVHFVLQKYSARAPAKERKAAETLLASLAAFAQLT